MKHNILHKLYISSAIESGDLIFLKCNNTLCTCFMMWVYNSLNCFSRLKSVIYHFRGNSDFARLRIGWFQFWNENLLFSAQVTIKMTNAFVIFLFRYRKTTRSNGSKGFRASKLQCNCSWASKFLAVFS